MIIDLGSSSEFNLPQGSKLAKQLLREFSFKNNERERYTIDRIETITEQIGEIEFKNVKTSINVSSQLGLEVLFLKTVLSTSTTATTATN